MGIAEKPATDAEHERTVTAHQQGERRLVAAAGESVEELGIVPAILLRGLQHIADVLQNARCAGHGVLRSRVAFFY
jgi:hypothetical protein